MKVDELHRQIAAKLSLCSKEQKLRVLRQTADNLVNLLADTSNHILKACKDNVTQEKVMKELMPQMRTINQQATEHVMAALEDPDDAMQFQNALAARFRMHTLHDHMVVQINIICGTLNERTYNSLVTPPRQTIEHSEADLHAVAGMIENAAQLLEAKTNKGNTTYVKTFLDMYMYFSLIMIAGSLGIVNASYPTLHQMIQSGLYRFLMSMTALNLLILEQARNFSPMAATVIIIGFAMMYAGKKDITWKWLLSFTAILSLSAYLPVYGVQKMQKAEFWKQEPRSFAMFNDLCDMVHKTEPSATEERCGTIVLQAFGELTGQLFLSGGEWNGERPQLDVILQKLIANGQEDVIRTTHEFHFGQLKSILYSLRHLPAIAERLPDYVAAAVPMSGAKVARNVPLLQASEVVFNEVRGTSWRAELAIGNQYAKQPSNSVMSNPIDETALVVGDAVGQGFFWSAMGYGAASSVSAYYTTGAAAAMTGPAGVAAVVAMGVALQMSPKLLTGAEMTQAEFMDSAGKTMAFIKNSVSAGPASFVAAAGSFGAKQTIRAAYETTEALDLTVSALSKAGSNVAGVFKDVLTGEAAKRSRISMANHLKYQACMHTILIYGWIPTADTQRYANNAARLCKKYYIEDPLKALEEAERDAREVAEIKYIEYD